MKKKKKFGGGEPKHAVDNGKSDGKVIGKGSKPNFYCFLCDANHSARDYLKREKLNTIIIKDGDKDTTHVNPIHVFNG
jgi:hypothetical protein